MNVSAICVFAAEKPIIQKLLVILDEETSTYNTKYNSYNNVEFINLDEFNNTYDNYVSYAVSTNNAQNNDIGLILHEAFENYHSKIYIYGGLTINEYKEILSVEDFYVNMNVCAIDSVENDTIKMRFDSNQENNKKEEIIALTHNSNSQSLTVSGDNISEEDAIAIIVDHFTSVFCSSVNRDTTLVYSSFGHRVYCSSNSSVYMNIDYMLYKEQSENDPTYNYYALKTNVTGTRTNPDSQGGSVAFNRIEVKHKLMNYSDNVTDYAPKDINRASNVSVKLNVGTSGSAINIGFSSGAGPSIDSSYDPNGKEVYWTVKRYWFFGKPFTGDMLTFATSWATKSSAYVNVSTYGVFTMVNNYAFSIDWDTQSVKFG